MLDAGLLPPLLTPRTAASLWPALDSRRDATCTSLQYHNYSANKLREEQEKAYEPYDPTQLNRGWQYCMRRAVIGESQHAATQHYARGSQPSCVVSV